MPWCPQCDEVFPDGAQCPRCRTSMVEVKAGSGDDDDAALPLALPALKVPRRVRRAFGLPGPSQPPRHVVGFAMALVLLAGGFVLGRMSGLEPGSPGLRPPSGPGLHTGRAGEVVLVRPAAVSGAADFEVVRNTVKDARLAVAHRLSAPYPVTGGADVAVVGLRRSVAVVVDADRGRSVVAALPAARPALHWLDGDEAAWSSPHELLIRRGTDVHRWSLKDEVSLTRVPGVWVRVYQTPTGAVLEPPGDARALVDAADGLADGVAIPAGAEVIAVGAGATRALVSLPGGPVAVVTGEGSMTLDLRDDSEPLGAAFSADGARVAITLGAGAGAGRRLAVLDARGSHLMLRALPQPDEASCRPVPVWDEAGRWVVVSAGDGTVHGFEVGGESRSATVPHLGCTFALGA